MSEITVTKYENYVECCPCGVFDDNSLFQKYRELWTSDDYKPNKPEIHDLRSAKLAQVTVSGILRITGLSRQFHPKASKHPIALLADDERDNFYSRMACRLSAERNPNVRVFRDHDEAVEWVAAEGEHTP